jgi:hypothetical protein
MKALIGTCAAALVLSGAGAAWAHPTGNERRSDEDCHRFERGMTKHKLKACMTCVKKGGHHFHPDGKKGHRCMADGEAAPAGATPAEAPTEKE